MNHKIYSAVLCALIAQGAMHGALPAGSGSAQAKKYAENRAREEAAIAQQRAAEAQQRADEAARLAALAHTAAAEAAALAAAQAAARAAATAAQALYADAQQLARDAEADQMYLMNQIGRYAAELTAGFRAAVQQADQNLADQGRAAQRAVQDADAANARAASATTSAAAQAAEAEATAALARTQTARDAVNAAGIVIADKAIDLKDAERARVAEIDAWYTGLTGPLAVTAGDLADAGNRRDYDQEVAAYEAKDVAGRMADAELVLNRAGYAAHLKPVLTALP